MTPQELDLGKTVLLTLAPVTGPDFPPGLRKGTEVRVWRDGASETLVMARSDAVCPVREFPPRATQLDNLCTMDPPRIAWIMDRRRSADGEHLRVQFHQFFPKDYVFPSLKIAVDERAFEQARRVNPKMRSVGEFLAWLSDECLLPDGGTGLGIRAFISMGGRKANSGTNAFALLGRSLRVFVRRDRLSGEDTAASESLIVDKVTRSRGDIEQGRIYLVSGLICFCDRTAAGELRVRDQAQLEEIATTDESFIRAWERYGQLEESTVYEQARSIGAFAYTGIEYLPEGIRFDLDDEDAVDRLPFIDAGDELEATATKPNLDIMTQADGGGETDRNERTQFVGVVAEPPASGSCSVILDPIDNQTPPDSGWLFLSILGDRKRFERRRDAREKIRSGRCPMPRLGLLLEGADVHTGRASNHKALTDRVLNKVFRTRDGRKNPPTPIQEEAIRVALNTPDIALIQGPPGTGKTTVIRAIIERLNEIADTSAGLSGDFLVTGFQHDAVENAIAKLDVNDLPAIKFGRRRGGVDGYEEAEARIDRWRQEKAEAIRGHFAAVPRSAAERRLKEILHAYVLAPGDLAQTINLLDEVSTLVRGQISPQLENELGQLRNDFECFTRVSRPEDPQLHRIVRAIRALRCTPTSFADDGPRTAGAAMATLSNDLNDSSRQLLERSSNWLSREVPPFLDELSRLRQRLLTDYVPPPRIAAVPHVRRDVAGMLSRVRDDLESHFRRSRSAPDVASAEFLDQLENNPEAVRTAIIAYTPVYAATCQQAASYRIADAKGGANIEYDTVLVDEAARSNPLDLFIPMVQARRRVILVGDHRQLPHIIDTAIQRELETNLASDGETAAAKTTRAIEESLFERLFRQLQTREQRDRVRRTVTLDKQYRMHPRLGHFVSEQFYPSHEQFGSGLPAADFAHDLPKYTNCYAAWVNVPFERGRERSGQSKSRPIEAEVIARELKYLIDSEAARHLTFGVITFYSAQVPVLGKHLTAVGLMTPLDRGRYRIAEAYRDLRLPDGKVVERLRVGTVDAFQGKEFDVVLLSMVRSNQDRDETEKDRRSKYGHLMSPNRLCVSMSRQKCLLIVFGDEAMLSAPHAAEAIKPLVAFLEFSRLEGMRGSIDQSLTVRMERERHK